MANQRKTKLKLSVNVFRNRGTKIDKSGGRIPPLKILPLKMIPVLFFGVMASSSLQAQTKLYYKSFVVDEYSPLKITPDYFNEPIEGGDTIFVSPKRTKSIYFEGFNGNESAPIVVTNFGGQVRIDDPIHWGAMCFKDCKFIKLSGAGSPTYKYGFKLSAMMCGVAFNGMSSDCEAEFVKIDHDGFFGFSAKEDFGGYPPTPIPVFKNLKIHDCYVTGVDEGMYLGETKSPGMEFKHVRVYNNIVINTGWEGIQISNMVEDVEIYNNTIYKAGQKNVTYQEGVFQIGGNSVAKVYNNIFSDAPGNGIAMFGKGDIQVFNNYISNNEGIFTDNRLFHNIDFSDTDPLITFTGNYFKNIHNESVIKSYNETNTFSATDNVWEENIPFFLNQSGNDTNTYLANNVNASVDTITFVDVENNNYALNPNSFQNIGAPGGPEIFDVIDPNADLPEQIVLTNDMLVDLTDGGSWFPSEHLIDEQEKTFVNGLKPTSQSWKPHYNMDHAPYHVYFDLKAVHHISQIGLHDMHNIKNLEVSYGKPGDWKPLFTESCDGYEVWKVHDTDVETQYIRLSMYESVFAAVNEINIFGYPVIAQIPLSDAMITDGTPGGSLHSPLYLIDEQDSNAIENQHPVSQSWKPAYTMANGPYHVTVDLGESYDIFSLFFHDMHGQSNLKVEYGTPGHWQELLIENCDDFKQWSQHKLNLTTQYLRLSMYESVYAAINEIQLFGMPSNDNQLVKESHTNEEESVEKSYLSVYPNPVNDLITIQIPKTNKEGQTIEILDVLGRVYHTELITEGVEEVHISTKEINLSKGFYFCSYKVDGVKQQYIKFYKY